MKRFLIAVYMLAVAFAFAGCESMPEGNGVRYVRSQSYALGNKYSLCFENATEKSLEFCVYGIFDDCDRSLGLDENGRLKTSVIQPNSVINTEYYFSGTSSGAAPKEVIIIGEYY